VFNGSDLVRSAHGSGSMLTKGSSRSARRQSWTSSPYAR
jgi:hypothetical protein